MLLISFLLKKTIRRINYSVIEEEGKKKIKIILNLDLKMIVTMLEKKMKEKAVLMAMMTVQNQVTIFLQCCSLVASYRLFPSTQIKELN
jgi:hypothetical protein